MAVPTVLFDACVLYPAPLRDLLMRLAATDLFRARWSDAIHDEWIRSVLTQRPDLEAQLARTRQLMDAHVMDCLVTGYEPLIDTLGLPDPGDRHVLAAAIIGRADLIVTKNLRDFPADRLRPSASKRSTRTCSCVACWACTNTQPWQPWHVTGRACGIRLARRMSTSPHYCGRS